MGLYIYNNNSGYNANNTGWWLTYPSEKYEFVKWDDCSQYGKIKHVPNHQPVVIICAFFALDMAVFSEKNIHKTEQLGTPEALGLSQCFFSRNFSFSTWQTIDNYLGAFQL